MIKQSLTITGSPGFLNDRSQKLARIGRIPARIRRDARLIWKLKNWREALAAEWHRRPLHHIELRNGIVLHSPEVLSSHFSSRKHGCGRFTLRQAMRSEMATQ